MSPGPDNEPAGILGEANRLLFEQRRQRTEDDFATLASRGARRQLDDDGIGALLGRRAPSLGERPRNRPLVVGVAEAAVRLDAEGQSHLVDAARRAARPQHVEDVVPAPPVLDGSCEKSRAGQGPPARRRRYAAAALSRTRRRPRPSPAGRARRPARGNPRSSARRRARPASRAPPRARPPRSRIDAIRRARGRTPRTPRSWRACRWTCRPCCRRHARASTPRPRGGGDARRPDAPPPSRSRRRSQCRPRARRGWLGSPRSWAASLRRTASRATPCVPRGYGGHVVSRASGGVYGQRWGAGGGGGGWRWPGVSAHAEGRLGRGLLHGLGVAPLCVPRLRSSPLLNPPPVGAEAKQGGEEGGRGRAWRSGGGNCATGHIGNTVTGEG